MPRQEESGELSGGVVLGPHTSKGLSLGSRESSLRSDSPRRRAGTVGRKHTEAALAQLREEPDSRQRLFTEDQDHWWHERLAGAWRWLRGPSVPSCGSEARQLGSLREELIL
jgi:hypothetical protein